MIIKTPNDDNGESTIENNMEEVALTEWRNEVHPIVVNQFTWPVGPTVPVGDILQLFYTFFTHTLIREIVQQTNLYAQQCLELQNKDETWETSAEDIAAYLGITLLMGINGRLDLYDYWSMSPKLHCYPIASVISRKRFLEIKRYLHFVDNTSLSFPCCDKLAKIRSVLEAVQNTSLTSYNPHKENSIDEAMIKFNGHSSIKQYMPKKPIKRGIKACVRADSLNGYISDFNIYCDKVNDECTNLGTEVVASLSETLKHQNYHLYFDNFFSSVELLETLLKDGMYACGTYRKDRKGIPRSLTQTKLGKYTFSLQSYLLLLHAIYNNFGKLYILQIFIHEQFYKYFKKLR